MNPPLNRRTVFGPLLFIYQMPKTGSQTVEATLRRCVLPQEIYRFHYLSPERAREIREGPADNKDPEGWARHSAEQLRAMTVTTRLIRVRKLLRACGLVPKLDVISAVREPIGAALSSIFENLGLFFVDTQSVTAAGCADILQRPRMVKSIQNWMDVEMEGVLGLDVYRRPFPLDKGYAIYENWFLRLLLYRFETLPGLPAMLNEFCGCEVNEVVNVNLGTSKPYSALYGAIKKELRLPPSFVRAQYSSKMARHFYSSPELESLTQRWSA